MAHNWESVFSLLNVLGQLLKTSNLCSDMVSKKKINK